MVQRSWYNSLSYSLYYIRSNRCRGVRRMWYIAVAILVLASSKYVSISGRICAETFLRQDSLITRRFDSETFRLRAILA